MINLNLQKGFSLVEVLLASALFALVITGLLSAFLYGQESAALAGNRSRAVALAEEGIQAARDIKEYDFSLIGSLSDGTYYLDNTSGVWELDGVSDTIGIYSREIEVTSIDGDTTEIRSSVSWQQNVQRAGLVEIVTRFTNWLENLLTQTTQVEFDGGAFNSTESTSTAGGEVQLQGEASWLAATQSTTYDMAGGGNPAAAFQEDNILWVARADNLLYELDISDISSGTITETATYNIGALPTGVFVQDNTAFVSTTENSTEVVLIDLTGTLPNVGIDITDVTDTTDIVVANNKIIVSRLSGTSPEIYVYNLSGGSLLGVVEVGATVNAIAVDDTYLYAATSDNNELWVIDYNNCTGGVGGNECTIETQYDPASGANADGTSIFVVGSNVYMGRDNGRIHGFAMSGPNVSSEFLDYDNSNDQINDIFVDENTDTIFAVTNDAGSTEMLIFDITTPGSPTMAEIDLDGGDNAVAVEKQGIFAYAISENTTEVQVYGAGIGGGWSSPQALDTVDTTGNSDGQDVFVSGNYAYLATNDSFWSFDISDPSNITQEDVINFNYVINDVYVSGNYAYLATGNNGSELVIVNIADPANMSVAGTFNTNGNQDGLSVWVSGGYAYIGTQNNGGGAGACTNSELYVLDITNPASISCAGSYDVGGSVWDVHVDSGDAFLATTLNSAEFMTLNVATPATITQRATYNRTGNNDGLSVWYQSSRLYAGAVGAGDDFYVFDVSDRNSLTLLGSTDTPGTDLRDIKIIGSNAFIGNDLDGSELVVLDITNADSDVFSTTATYSGFSGGDCNGLATDGTNIFMACEGDASEFQAVGPLSASGTTYSWEGWFTSSAIDSDATGTTWSAIQWSEGDVGAVSCSGGDVVFQLRTAPDSGGSPGVWTDWLGPINSNDYYDDPAGGDAINATHSDGSNDQWLQYRAYFTSDSTCSKSLEDITFTY